MSGKVTLCLKFKKSIISPEALIVSIPPSITCLRLTIETLEQGVKYVQT